MSGATVFANQAFDKTRNQQHGENHPISYTSPCQVMPSIESDYKLCVDMTPVKQDAEWKRVTALLKNECILATRAGSKGLVDDIDDLGLYEEYIFDLYSKAEVDVFLNLFVTTMQVVGVVIKAMDQDCRDDQETVRDVNVPPPTRESLAWFQARREQWENSPRKKVKPLPPPHDYDAMSASSDMSIPDEEMSNASEPKEAAKSWSVVEARAKTLKDLEKSRYHLTVLKQKYDAEKKAGVQKTEELFTAEKENLVALESLAEGLEETRALLAKLTQTLDTE
jgi:hypothetical protein